MEKEITELRGTANVLHLICHRNKNQHRRGLYWKWLSMLKRCVEKVIAELVIGDRSRLRAHVLYVESFLLPRCYV